MPRGNRAACLVGPCQVPGRHTPRPRQGSAGARAQRGTVTMPDSTNAAFRGSVLIADDHAVYRMGLMDLLRRRLKVTRFHEAACFAEVPDLVKSADVALAVIDLCMPGLSGPDDIAQLRRLRPEAR